MTKDDALEIALDYVLRTTYWTEGRDRHDTLKAIKEALAQPEQEPVAWMYDWFCDGKLITGWIAHSESEIIKPRSMALNLRPLYTTPPQRPWVGLTDEEVHALWMTGEANISEEAHSVTAYEVEAKLKELNK